MYFLKWGPKLQVTSAFRHPYRRLREKKRHALNHTQSLLLPCSPHLDWKAKLAETWSVTLAWGKNQKLSFHWSILNAYPAFSPSLCDQLGLDGPVVQRGGTEGTAGCRERRPLAQVLSSAITLRAVAKGGSLWAPLYRTTQRHSAGTNQKSPPLKQAGQRDCRMAGGRRGGGSEHGSSSQTPKRSVAHLFLQKNPWFNSCLKTSPALSASGCQHFLWW